MVTSHAGEVKRGVWWAEPPCMRYFRFADSFGADRQTSYRCATQMRLRRLWATHGHLTGNDSTPRPSTALGEKHGQGL